MSVHMGNVSPPPLGTFIFITELLHPHIYTKSYLYCKIKHFFIFCTKNSYCKLNFYTFNMENTETWLKECLKKAYVIYNSSILLVLDNAPTHTEIKRKYF